MTTTEPRTTRRRTTQTRTTQTRAAQPRAAQPRATQTRWTNTRFEMLDPRTILLDKNARTIDDIAKEDPDLVDSVGRHGVLQPAIAHPVGDGHTRMHDGHKRALANILHIDKFPLMPVIITDLVDETAHAWLRDMWVFNEQRQGFSATEKVAILEQMALDGLSDEDIASQLSLPPDTVRAGRRVHANELARQALQRNEQLTFVQADAFTEFADDPAFVERLNTALDEPETFDHVVSELQQERASRLARDEMIEKLRADDVHVLEDDEMSTAERLGILYQSRENQTRLSHDIDAHKACAGHAARVRAGDFGPEPRVDYWCRNWRSHGHISLYSTADSGARKGKRTSAETAEYKRVVRNNKKWLAAIPVRRRKITELMAMKELPVRVHQQMALAIEGGDVKYTPQSKALACELLGFAPKRGVKVKLATKLKRASADRAVMINLALLIAAFEIDYDLKHKKNTWRSPTTNDKVYFGLLRGLWGADIPMNVAERLVIDPNADRKDWPHLQAGSAPSTPAPDAGDGEIDDTDDTVDEVEDSGDDAHRVDPDGADLNGGVGDDDSDEGSDDQDLDDQDLDNQDLADGNLTGNSMAA